MDELNQFLNSVESSARRILKQQNKKQQELLIKERAALVRASKNGSTASSTTSSTTPSVPSSSPVKSVSREELKATYSPGGALIIPAPTTPLKSPSRRSENDDSGPTYLPRLSSSVNHQSPKSSSTASPSLPAIDVARKAQRDKRAVDKIVNSPLYKSMAKTKADEPRGLHAPNSVQQLKKAIHEVDHVDLLLQKLGMRAGHNSPAKRPSHAVEKRMCHACWASPDKGTGCEHHGRVMPTSISPNNNLTDEAQLLRQLELQGPTSWLSNDLYTKYRSETDREALWRAFVRLKDAEREREQRGEVFEVAVVPIVARHPICATYETQVELANLQVQAATRRRNQAKKFVFDVNHIWLTNLDHFNVRLVAAQRRRQRRLARQVTAQVGNTEDGRMALPQSEEDDDENDDDPAEYAALRDRRDEAAIRDGFSQIQSISTARALEKAIFPTKDPSTSTFALPRQGSMTSAKVPASPSSKRRKRPRERPFQVAPLTLLVCGEWNPTDPFETSSLTCAPGIALVGTRRVLWWIYVHDDPEIEYTKAVAMFARSKTLSSTNAILVRLTLAIDAPLLSPLWCAWHIGSKIPPPPPFEPPLPIVLPPQHVSHCLHSLLSTKLQTRIDTLLPGTIMLFNTVPHPLDFVFQLDEPYGHRRFWTEFQKRDAFRQWWGCTDTSLLPNYDVDPQQCSVLVAQPNAISIGGRFTWHAVDAVDGHLNRLRREKDYVYIIQNHLTCGSNGPLWFIVAMNHEIMKDVAAAKLSSYLMMLEDRRKKKEYEDKLLEIEKKIELGRLQLDAQRQEQKRIEQELSAKAARAADRFRTDPLSEAALDEWEQRLGDSVVTNEQVGWQRREITGDQSQVVFYYSLNEALPRNHRFSWDKPIAWPDDDGQANVEGEGLTSWRATSTATSRSDESIEDDDGLNEEQRANRAAIEQMANALLSDEKFLRVLKAKLGLDSSDEDESNKRKKPRRRHDGEDEEEDDEELDAEQLDLRDHMIRVTEEKDRSKASLMATKMAKLQLPAQGSKRTPSKPGDGWKRLQVSKLPPNFARSVYGTHTEGPRSAFLNQPNHSTPVGMIDPRESSPYEPPDFIPELRVLLIPKANADLQEKKLQWAEYLATRPSDEALPSGSPARMISKTQAAKDALFEKDPAEHDMTMEQLVAKAVLCARNNNLQGLEDALDNGCDVNARDNHGNTLFILVCQQGNKKIAKFLMRRHADVNLQNLNGNTALHYLIEYKHHELAEYLKAKGASDTIPNAAGLTCYEGLSMDQAEAL